MAKLIGTVTHYYDKIGVAVIDLDAPLKIGDTVEFTGSNQFTQAVDSMQVEHAQISYAKKGESFGLKVNQPVKPKDKVSLV